MTTVAEIAKEAFDDVAAEMPEVIQTAELRRTTRGAYDPRTGTYAEIAQAYPCRVLFSDERAMADTFPAFVSGPTDRMVYVEGIQTVPVENDRMTIGSRGVVVRQVGDIVGVGSFFALVVRNA